MANFWHYTTKERLKEILNSGVIKTSLHNSSSKNEKETLWVSKNPRWEPTATKMIMTPTGPKLLSVQEQFELVGLGRIKINDKVKFYSWKDFKKIGGGNLKSLRKMEESGVRLGANPLHWFCSFVNIEIDNWTSIEYWNGEQWIEYKLEE
jgi:hypothetical protein